MSASELRVVALDANAVTALFRGELNAVPHLQERKLCLPCVVFGEVVEGWIALAERHHRLKQEARLAAALARLCEFHEWALTAEILRYTEDAQRAFAALGAGRGDRSRNDLRIAAICIAHRVPLVTRNLADFQDLPGLTLITW